MDGLGTLKRYTLVCPAFSVDVETDEHHVIQISELLLEGEGTHDVVRFPGPCDTQFVGRPLDQLLQWMSHYGTVESVQF